MIMRKKRLFKAFALVAALSCAVGAHAHDFAASSLYFNIIGTNTVEVTYNDNNSSYNSYSGNVTIPSTVDYDGTTYNVTRIGNFAFRNSSGLTGVSIPYSISRIGNFAFYECTNLIEVTIPNSVTYLGYDAFGKTGLTSVYVPSSVTYMGSEMFYCCTDLLSVRIDARITTIDMRSFQGCTSLDWIEIPHGVTTIGSDAFKGCTSLRVLTIPPSVTTIKSGAFNGCTALIKVSCYASTPPSLYDDNVFPTEAYNNATLVVPGSAESAYRAADGWKLFSDISGLSYDFALDNLKYVITSSTTAKCIGSVLSSPEGCWQIPETAYGYDVTEIGESAFANCSQMTDLVIGSNVTEIGSMAFQGCTGLTSMIIPNSVTHVGGMAFYGCSSLNEVVIGENCRFNNSYSWSMNIFKDCTSLSSITCLSEEPWAFREPMFDETTYSTAVLWVPNGSQAGYWTTDYWNRFGKIKGIYTLDEALNVAGGDIHFSTSGWYPWVVEVSDDDVPHAQSGNAGASNTSSVLTATVNVIKASTLSFDFKAWGEGTSTLYDECIFAIDGQQMFSYGARQNDWETYTAELAPGTHTLTWTYDKDGSVNPTGDYFAINNVAITSKVVVLGDVNNDGNVSILDVTALIDYLLTGDDSRINLQNADCNNDNSITIIDVTALIDYLLTSSQIDYYIVGSDPFGGWDPGAGVKMTKNTDGSYSCRTTINGTIWFIFSSGLDSDWDVFNSQYRFEPVNGTNETIQVGTWHNAERRVNGTGAYRFDGTDNEYVLTFVPGAGMSPSTAKFKIEEIIPIETYTVAGDPIAVFGSSWDIYNTDNDMTLTASGLYELNKHNCQLNAGTVVQFKVVGNRDWDNSWPTDNVTLNITATGNYNLRFTFDPRTGDCQVYKE